MRSSYRVPTLLKVILILFITIVISLALVYFIVSSPKTIGNDIEISFLIYIATASLAIIAYVEFHRANQLNTNELLTFISNRWSSKEIIKARQIIHEIFVEKYRNDKICNFSQDFDIAVGATSISVLEMSRKGGKEGKKFIYLLNLLDHFESISYLHVANQIEFDDIKNIYGNNMFFYYQIFKKYIERRQSHHSSDFCNYSKMYNIFSKHKPD